jgi:hypothetical protein
VLDGLLQRRHSERSEESLFDGNEGEIPDPVKGFWLFSVFFVPFVLKVF